jgi:uncharacterized protein
MIAYLDSSVLLRVVLNQKNKLREFSKLRRPVASRLLKTECFRTLDRIRVNGTFQNKDYLQAMNLLHTALDSVEYVSLSESVLDRAAMSLPIALGTLDAIHLVSALIWREQMEDELMFLTHDMQLASCAQALGFKVLGT